MSIRLPVASHPPLTAYDRYAFWLSILLGACPDALPWIAAEFMQIQSVMDGEEGKLLPYTERSWNLSDERLLIVQAITMEAQVLRGGVVNMLSLAKDMLRHGHYVMAALDGQAVSAATKDGLQQASYHCLLYGYDDQTQHFAALGSVGKQAYRSFVLSYAEFEQGFYDSRLRSHNVDFFQVAPTADFTVTPSKAIQALQNYRSPVSEHRGMKAVQSWIEQWDEHSQQYSRSWLTFKEHIGLTSQLLRQIPWNGADDIYTPVVCHAQMIDGLVADYRLNGGTEVLSQIRRELIQLLEREGQALDSCMRAAACLRL